MTSQVFPSLCPAIQRTVACLSAGLCMLCVGYACAQDGQSAGNIDSVPASETASALHAGKLSFDDFKAIQLLLIEEQFSQLDTDQDGYLDANERRLGLRKLQEQMQQQAQPLPTSAP